jgi:tetratricopeptide (TPR) repeat protein
MASRRTEHDADPFASRLTRNLHGLAKAAQEFHYAASSTASTRYEAGVRRSSLTPSSSWSESDFERLTDTKRDRIDKWNNEMGALEEVQEEDVLSNGELSSTDPSTAITNPDLDDQTDKSHNARKEVRENENEFGDEESDDDGSDIELDFLKNFDELACSSFLRKDYSKAEQFLRKAMERNTGESSNGEHFKLLRIRLAICCCLQERWELAAGALSALSKSRAASNLPVFDLLQAISLGYLANDRFDDAYRVCKSALQGKKKVVGKDSGNFHECLWILAMIYEKRGDPLEAEAVRLSIPVERMPTEGTMSGKEYILEHPTLIKSAFGGNEKEKGPTDQPKNESTEATRSNEAYVEPDRWEDLMPRAAVDGTSRAEKDERSKAPIGATDTGKIFLLQSTGSEDLIPRRGTGLGISKAISDEYSGKQIGEFDSGKEVAADTGEAIGTAKNGVPSPNMVKPDSAGQDRPRETRAGPKKDLWYALYGKWHWEDLLLHLNSEQGAEENRSPDWYSTLEVVVDDVSKGDNEEAHIRVDLAGNSDASNPRLRTDEQSGVKMLTSESGREDVVSPDSKDSARIPWGIERGIEVRAQGSWRSWLPLPLDRTAVDRASSNFYIGVNLNLGDASFAMSGEQVPLCDSVVSEPHLKTSYASNGSRYLTSRISAVPRRRLRRMIVKTSGSIIHGTFCACCWFMTNVTARLTKRLSFLASWYQLNVQTGWITSMLL